MKTILHIITGGTIGGVVPEYAEIEKIAGLFADTVDFKKHITKGFSLKATYEEVEVCKKDSRYIVEADRVNIIKVITDAYERGVRSFLITHGTYTLPETMQHIQKNLAPNILQQVRVVGTGSMYPWNLFGSDAPMNLGAALGDLVNNDEPGVFILMHGKRFTPDNITKDVRNYVFNEEK
jgi:L-asparaginase/Glu-tRNA(Gln) amidotransferase subunit D